MAVASVVDLDLGKAAPILVLGVLGLGAWWLWQRSQQQAQANAAAQQASPIAEYQAAADLALLQSFAANQSTENTSSTTVTGNTPVADPALPTYTSPTNPAAVNTSSATTTGNLGLTVGTAGNGL